ncbi:MAG: glycosyltransferase [Candidatus Aenigmarchaeota archaeon]|nr:glycosyltransferase [Candidatus Aenigmarchaeota archaeon]NIQ18008.1 glycosyltransferase [Candidatus Aenigmarchaeota archaeon]
MKHPKILVGAPVTDLMEYCFDRFIESIRNLTYPSYDIFLVDNSKEDRFFNKVKGMGIPVERIEFIDDPRVRLVKCRNMIREKVIKGCYDYMYCADQDVIPPKTVLEDLLKHQKKVVSGVYYNITPEGKPISVIRVPANEDTFEEDNLVRPLTEEEMKTPRLVRVGLNGTGCLLIHRSVLQRIKFRNELNAPIWDDTTFAMDCIRNKIPMFADIGIKCDHLLKEKPWNWKIKAERTDDGGLSVKKIVISPKSDKDQMYYY